ncbi:MAG: hypothetical protein Q9213_001162 [Squamulea squamosa]
MRHASQWLWLSAFVLSAFPIAVCLPHEPPVGQQQQAVRRNNKRNLLASRDDDAFLGDDWDIPTMENHVAYVPHERAAADLADFYTSLLTIATSPITPPNHWLLHGLGRVVILFDCTCMAIPWELIARFAQGMLEFTRRGYTSSYRMQFRHVTLDCTITVMMSILDHDPEDIANCVAPEEHGQINQSGIQQHQICMRPPSFPDPGQGSGPSF